MPGYLHNSPLLMKSVVVVLLPFWLIISITSGCATFPVNETSPNHLSLKEQVEELFRRQNNAASEVMMLSLDETDNEEFEELSDAELKMQNACTALNEYAVRSRDQLSLGFFLQQRVLSEIDLCDDATQIVESLLRDFMLPQD